MNSYFLYRAWGLYHHECLGEEYKGNTIILHSKVRTHTSINKKLTPLEIISYNSIYSSDLAIPRSHSDAQRACIGARPAFFPFLPSPLHLMRIKY